MQALSNLHRSINLKNRPRRKKRELSVSDYVEGIVKGDVTVLSQAANTGGKCETGAPGCGAGGDREVFALFGQLRPRGYQWCARCR